MTKRIVTVQDISCLGQCSITVALPVLSALGVETAILPSAILSTHSGGFQNYAVHDLTEEMPKIVEHWTREGLEFDAIYTGYIGNARQFDTILRLRKLLKPNGFLAVDPAMADHGKLYKGLNSEIVRGMRKLVSIAKVILPNLTEACFLLDKPYMDGMEKNLSEIQDLAKELSRLGPRYSIITGVVFSDDEIGSLCYDKETDRFTEARAKRYPKSYHGTGDLFSSVCIGNLVLGETIEKAMSQAADFVSKAIDETVGDETHTYGVHFEKVLAKSVDK